MSRAGYCAVRPYGRFLALCAAIWLCSVTAAGAASQGEWLETGAPLAATNTGSAIPEHLVVLANGTVRLFGRETPRVQRYEADSGTWVVEGVLQSPPRDGATVTVLAVDVVLLAGGSETDGKAQSAAELYFPATGLSIPTGSMRVARRDHRATLLASGKVLVTGGRGVTGQLVASTEVYDPQSGTW